MCPLLVLKQFVWLLRRNCSLINTAFYIKWVPAKCNIVIMCICCKLHTSFSANIESSHKKRVMGVNWYKDAACPAFWIISYIAAFLYNFFRNVLNYKTSRAYDNIVVEQSFGWNSLLDISVIRRTLLLVLNGSKYYQDVLALQIHYI